MENHTLYHYCSFSSFLAIIKNHTIQLSDITKSNDSQEIKFLFEHYISYTRSRTNNALPSHMLKYEIDNQMANTDFLVVCFSEKKDSLDMWSRYAKGGVCIGFDYNKLLEWAKHIHFFDNGVAYDKSLNNNLAKLGQVKYYNKEAVDEFISQQCKYNQFVTDSFPTVFAFAPFAKTDFWKDELEWRISIPLIYQDKLDFSHIPANVHVPEKVEMSFEANRQFPLCLKCFVPFDVEMIVDITLAPDCKAEISDIKKVLRISGFDHLNDNEALHVSSGSIR